MTARLLRLIKRPRSAGAASNSAQCGLLRLEQIIERADLWKMTG